MSSSGRSRTRRPPQQVPPLAQGARTIGGAHAEPHDACRRLGGGGLGGPGHAGDAGFLVVVVVRLGQLDDDAHRGLGVEKRFGIAPVESTALEDRVAHASGALADGAKFVDMKGDVVDAGSVALQEALEEASPWPLRFQDLQLASAGIRPVPKLVLACGSAEAGHAAKHAHEKVRSVANSLHPDGDVVQRQV